MEMEIPIEDSEDDMEQNLYQQLCAVAGEENVLMQEPMSRHTTFRIGGPADYFVLPQAKEMLAQVVALCKEDRIPWYIIGNGSNLLVSDAGVRGVVIQLFKNYNEVRIEGNRIYAQAGASNAVIAHRALEASLTGYEFAAGIPGCVGGAVVMNAGAYGGEMKDILLEVTALNEQGQFVTIPKAELELGYRTSIIAKKGYVVVEAVFELAKGDPTEIKDRMEDLKNRRISKQPLEYPSAGSTFKRPEGYFAGKLIMDAGLRGFSVGDAQVSEKHCGFVINKGTATAKDVETLMAEVQRIVYEKFKVTLETEVKRLPNMVVTVTSFGFKYGIPMDANLVFDARFLPNPFYVEELKSQTGNDEPVQEYVMGCSQAGEFLDQLTDMIEFLIPNYIAAGKTHLVIAVGCTGGKHRSVTIANKLYERISGQSEYQIKIEHRDVLR